MTTTTRTEQPEQIAWRFATHLLAEGARRGVRDRAVAAIRRLSRDMSLAESARAVYVELIELEDAADQLASFDDAIGIHTHLFLDRYDGQLRPILQHPGATTCSECDGRVA